MCLVYLFGKGNFIQRARVEDDLEEKDRRHRIVVLALLGNRSRHKGNLLDQTAEITVNYGSGCSAETGMDRSLEG